ncbi:MAG: RNA polymerase sigma factor [Kiritimatiellae bacterium]|nr:RNA polymerase sigma factor [Kiritimatiellia bacterium]
MDVQYTAMEIAEEISKCPESGARRLIAEYGDRLYDTAFRLCQDESAARDLVNCTLWRAIERIGLFSGVSSMYTWLYSILVNFWRMELRQKKKMDILLFQDEMPDCPDERPDPAEALAAKADSEAIRNAIAELPEYYRVVVVFRYFEDMSVPEIAVVLGIPEGTVKFRLHKAKNMMRRKLAQTIDNLPASKKKERR